MFELFLNPWSMVAGGALISSPIIIHLINRMRFKRIRWAAMEFLLKSQKRNRRRLIIEQLILLLLRILLVLLAGLLLARLLASGFVQQQSTLHVLILDDTVSMTDHWREDGETKDTFDFAKRTIVDKIAKNAAQASGAQSLVLLRLSDLESSQRYDRLNNETVDEIRRYLDGVNCSALHVDLVKGLDKARGIFDEHSQGRRLLYIVSDFRQVDWTEGAESLSKTISEMSQQNKIDTHLLDVAHPYRGETQRTALYHDNVGIVDLRPESRVAAKFMPLQCTVYVANYGASDRRNVRVTVKVNGIERQEASTYITSIPAGATVEQVFQVSGLDRLGFSQITANVEDEENGLQADNLRYAVVEVRDRVPILVIDGAPGEGAKPGGDTFSLQAIFDHTRGAARGYDIVARGVAELEQANLNQYPSIYLLNVRDLNRQALRNLERYVADGGSVGFFLGDRVNPDFYNKSLWADGKGLFPAPLADRPTVELSEEEKQQKLLQNLLDPQLQILVRPGKENHTIFAEVWKQNVRGIFKFLAIDRYWPVSRTRWNPEPGKVEELVTLPSRRSMEDYQDRTREIVKSLPEQAEKYGPGLLFHQRALRALGPKDPLYRLAAALESLLTDPGVPTNLEGRPNLVEFWDEPAQKELRGQVQKLLDDVRYGDPLVITGRYGKGRVVVFTTSAGQKWNNWAGMFPVSATYPVFMVELQKFLTSTGTDANLTVGTPVTIHVDSGRYEEKMELHRLPTIQEGLAAKPVGSDKEGAPAGGNEAKIADIKPTSTADGRLTFVLEKINVPGNYKIVLGLKSDAGANQARTEERAFSFNVDTNAEGNLQRATREQLDGGAPGAALHTPLDDTALKKVLANRPSDWSESPWFFLIFLIILVVEQALAVHLSFHLRGGEAQLPSQAVTPHAVAA